MSNSEYLKHLESVSEEVASAPRWKQGGIGVANPGTTARVAEPLTGQPYWDLMQRTANKVATWPDWKTGQRSVRVPPAQIATLAGDAPERRHYVLGFVFSEGLTAVMLIHKKRPERLAGLLDGVGGKIEPGETPLQAMVRECEEESNLAIEPSRWAKCAVLETGRAHITVFGAVATRKERSDDWQTMTDEEIEWHYYGAMARKLAVYNVPGLIEMAASVIRGHRVVYHVREELT